MPGRRVKSEKTANKGGTGKNCGNYGTEGATVKKKGRLGHPMSDHIVFLSIVLLSYSLINIFRNVTQGDQLEILTFLYPKMLSFLIFPYGDWRSLDWLSEQPQRPHSSSYFPVTFSLTINHCPQSHCSYL